MRVALLIDSLAPGGAQRQICQLALLLKDGGCDSTVFTYRQNDFFLPLLERGGVSHQRIESTGGLGRVFAVRRALHAFSPDVVVAFLNAPSIYAELAGVPNRSFALIVSERIPPAASFLADLPRTLLHTLADRVVCNSHRNESIISKRAPWLRARLSTIVNCVDDERFYPPSQPRKPGKTLRLLGLGRYTATKNQKLIIAGLSAWSRADPDVSWHLEWFGDNFFSEGKPTDDSAYYLESVEEVQRAGLESQIHLNPHRPISAELFHGADVLCVGSFNEGVSNVVGEALACGVPVVATRVGDMPRMITNGVEGFLFDAGSPAGFAEAIRQFYRLCPADRQEMATKAAERAKLLLGKERFLAEYGGLLSELRKG